MAASGHTVSPRGLASALQSWRGASALAVILALFCSIADGWAKDRGRGSRGGFGDFERQSRDSARRQQAEMERQRREQERATQRAMREAEQRDTRGRDDWDRAPQRAWPGDDRRERGADNDNNKRVNAAARGDGKGNGDGKKASNDGDENDEAGNDWNLSDAERRVREIGRARQHDLTKAQQEHDVARQKEQARSDRIREHTLRRRERDLAKVTRLPPPPKKPAAIVPVAAAGKAESTKEFSERRAKVLDELASRASHLGMRPDAAIKGGQDKDGGRPAEADVSGRAALLGGFREALPGRPEPSSAASDKERGEELVVTEPSAEDIEKAKAHGFTVSDPVELKGSGTKVRRLSSPGIAREEAERELHKVLPFLPVTPNYAYTIFMGTLGESEGASALSGGSIGPALAEPCSAKSCFGGRLIKWTGGLSSCTKNVKIGIIDTSFDIGHPTFKNLNSIQGEFLSGERPSPYDWHGTAVLSLLAGDPHSGTPGLVPDATFLLATAFRSDSNGNASTDTVRLLAALDWLDQLDVDIVNMSFSGPQDPALAKAIARMSKKGVVFIAAAGNMGPTAGPSYPAAYPHVIAVTAVNRKGVSYKSANRGKYIDVAAPGVDILTALPNAKQGYRTGTSFAVPFVTAILAAEAGQVAPEAADEASLLGHLSTRDLGPPGQDPIYGAGLALAPRKCVRGGEAVADKSPPASLEAWSAQTTLIKAGAAFAP